MLIYFAIAIIIIVVGLIIILLYLTLKKNPPLNLQNSGGFLQFCSPNLLCQDGLVCDNSSATCKKPIGSTCIRADDCDISQGAYCSGVCVEIGRASCRE